MTKNTIVGIGVAVVILILAIVWLLVGRQAGEVTLTPTPSPIVTPEVEEPTLTPIATQTATPSAKTVEIKITDAGFSPATVEITAGGTITWVNNTSREVQIAANPHPVHTGNREVSAGQFALSLQPGGRKLVTIEKTGSFGYHNHLSPGLAGTIVSK